MKIKKFSSSALSRLRAGVLSYGLKGTPRSEPESCQELGKRTVPGCGVRTVRGARRRPALSRWLELKESPWDATAEQHFGDPALCSFPAVPFVSGCAEPGCGGGGRGVSFALYGEAFKPFALIHMFHSYETQSRGV